MPMMRMRTSYKTQYTIHWQLSVLVARLSISSMSLQTLMLDVYRCVIVVVFLNCD